MKQIFYLCGSGQVKIKSDSRNVFYEGANVTNFISKTDTPICSAPVTSPSKVYRFTKLNLTWA